MDLLALADFTLVARHGGFGKAARSTGRPKATLSRRVAELEGSLIPILIDQNPCVHWRSPMDMMRQGWSMSLFQASQQ
jgi:hypothetical protein